MKSISLLTLITICIVGCKTTTPSVPETEPEPTPPTRQEPKEKTVSRIVLSVDSGGNISIDNKTIGLDDIPNIVTGSPRVMIRANSATPYNTVEKIMAKLGEVGVTDLIFATYEN